MTVTCII